MCEIIDEDALPQDRSFFAFTALLPEVPKADLEDKFNTCAENSTVSFCGRFSNGQRSVLFTLQRVPQSGSIFFELQSDSGDKERESAERLRSQQQVIESLLLLSFQKISLREQLSLALSEILAIPWLPLTAKGAVFLKENGEEKLSLTAQQNMPHEVQELCREVEFGQCLCGRAAQEKKFIFASELTQELRIRFENMENHSHYVVPILLEEELLGVLLLYAEAGYESNEDEKSFLVALANSLAHLIDRRLSEQRLAKSEADLARAQKIAHLGHWEWDIVKGTLHWSDEIFDIFGLPHDPGGVTYENFLHGVHPDDQERVQEAVKQALDKNEDYSINHRVIRPSGEIRVVHEEGELRSGSDGAPLWMFGTIQDITQLKQTEEQLLLAGQVFDSSIEGISITDADGVIRMINPAFSHITGYSAEEAIGHKPSILKSDRHESEFYETMWGELLEKGRWQGEIWNRRKSGEVYPEWLTITAIKDERGEVFNYVAVFHDMSEIRSYEEQLHFQAYHDALTGLPNRTLMLDRLQVAVSHSQRSAERVAVLVVDLDNFKHINDSFGHTIGDVMLQQVGERIKKCVAEDVTVARLGGDDFAVLFEELVDEKEAVLLAEKVIEAFSAPFNLAVYESFITVSVGVTFFPEDGKEPDTLLKNAELAMYRAKEEGKNKYQLFTKTMNAQVVHRLSLENSLRKALEREEFLVYYQPKVGLGDGGIIGTEALIRWQSRTGRLVSPLEFIPLAEETGLIVPLGAWVLEESCRQAKKWLATKEIVVSVNLSPGQFRQKQLLSTIESVLNRTGLPPANLELEITEGVVMANEEAALSLLHSLKEIGVKLALDDFGTGYSSLHYLRKLPFDTLKIDRSFVRDIPEDADSIAIVSTILSLAHHMELNVVAEGVENEAQLTFLRNHDCQEMQGYFYSPPVPEAEFFKLLQEDKRI